MKNKAVPTYKVMSVLVVVFAFLLLAGCSNKATWTPPPTSTPQPTATDTPTPSPTADTIAENSVVSLPDGSLIILKSGADVKISELPDLPVDSTGVNVLIKKGEILVVPASVSPDWLSVISSKGYVARVKGCAMIVTFNEVKDSFGLSCIGGECEIGKDINHMISAANNKDWLYQGGIYFEPTAINYEKIYKSYGKVIPACVRAAEGNVVQATNPPKTQTPLGIIGADATATAACATFHNIFPATPCPK